MNCTRSAQKVLSGGDLYNSEVFIKALLNILISASKVVQGVLKEVGFVLCSVFPSETQI